jgi:hypothetical protein
MNSSLRRAWRANGGPPWRRTRAHYPTGCAAAPVRDEQVHVCGNDSVFSLECFLQDQLVQRQLRHCLQTPVLPLKVLQAPHLIDLQPAIQATPPVLALLRDAKAPTNLAVLWLSRTSASRNMPIACSGV